MAAIDTLPTDLQETLTPLLQVLANHGSNELDLKVMRLGEAMAALRVRVFIPAADGEVEYSFRADVTYEHPTPELKVVQFKKADE